MPFALDPAPSSERLRSRSQKHIPPLITDLKPENLIFRTKREDADVMIADFGLSRVMEEEKFQLLTEICGTPGVSFFRVFVESGFSWRS